MRLIDADALMESAKGYSPIQGELCGYYDFAWLVNAEPTVDAVEVVRCNWIPVSERLPKRGEYALFAYAKDNRNPTMYAKNTMAVGRYDQKMFLVEGCAVKVTHWMPLPEPPKEDHHET